ncbi:unnamed protein product [Penicillium bialowiezense]
MSDSVTNQFLLQMHHSGRTAHKREKVAIPTCRRVLDSEQGFSRMQSMPETPFILLLRRFADESKTSKKARRKPSSILLGLRC